MLKSAGCEETCCRLLDILADRKGKKGVAGTVLVNGKRRPKNFKCISGYVVQVLQYKHVQIQHPEYIYILSQLSSDRMIS